MQFKIDWLSFEAFNQDPRGIRYKFEDLCRQLFQNEHLSKNRQFCYLHANPNNPGLEDEPIFDEVNKRMIGFQAKFFDSKVNYGDIKESALQIVKHYQGKVDCVFWFCNKTLSSESKGLKNTQEILDKANIELQLVTDEAILDLVRVKYPNLAAYYFGHHSLQIEWFQQHATYMYEMLGERFQRDFNVENRSYHDLSLFLHDLDAVKSINHKKHALIEKISDTARYYSCYWRYSEPQTSWHNNAYCSAYLNTLQNAVSSLQDVDEETLCKSLHWHQDVVDKVKSYLEEFEAGLSTLEDEYKKLTCKTHERSLSKKLQQEAQDKEKALVKNIERLKNLLQLPDIIKISVRAQQLLQCRVMALHGSAGVGKSQLLANKCRYLLSHNRVALLLLGGMFLASDPIEYQIMRNLEFEENYTFTDLIDALETVGQRDNRIIPIFIDALNETWHHELWKGALLKIVDKVNQQTMVKLVFSYRTEYEKVLLSDIKKNGMQNGKVFDAVHNGFADNSHEAVLKFLNHYNIPFTLPVFLSYETTNPLFLTLYCRTYNGEDVSLPRLYERFIEEVSAKINYTKYMRTNGFEDPDSDDLLNAVIASISECMLKTRRKLIFKNELYKLDCWSYYGVAPARYISLLVKEKLLYNSCLNAQEYYFFAYDQMNDYFCAKAILSLYKGKNEVLDFLGHKVLNIKDGKLVNHEVSSLFFNTDLFVNACAVYAEKYGEECLGIIDELTDSNDRCRIFSAYIKSLPLRSSPHLSPTQLFDLLKKYPCDVTSLFDMLIDNSVKVSNPLNANFLHDFLSKYSLSERDYLWTIYINRLTDDSSNRLVQIIKMYESGDKLQFTSEEQVELFLTLLCWVLTSSNRWLRDYTSKAMIEILKVHFNLCVPLLKKFSTVNDPYVIQRLYGVVFGACCKREDDDLTLVAEYVYDHIFNKDLVYPDLLLRDYARLIIERFLWETPQYQGIIEHRKIVPPYNSLPIPKILDQHYEDCKDYASATFCVIKSMRIDTIGFYGDFGRYVFQSALRNFDVDLKELFNYAIYYIINDLGFCDGYFNKHDRNCNKWGFNRTVVVKTERIGKKYQWIAFYNILARVADHYNYYEDWSHKGTPIRFKGAWDPYVRDFDPTLNKNFMICKDAPVFKSLSEHIEKGRAENIKADVSDQTLKKQWIKNEGVFLKDLKTTLLLKDDKDIQWVCLTKYCDTDDKNSYSKKISVWLKCHAYFVSAEDADCLADHFKNLLPHISCARAIDSYSEIYTVFNREYPWSPSYSDYEEYASLNLEVEPQLFKPSAPIKQKLSNTDPHFRQPVATSQNTNADKHSITCENKGAYSQGSGEAYCGDKSSSCEKHKKNSHEFKNETKTVNLLHATTDLLWEEEYDASKEQAISYSLPCKKLVDKMGLKPLTSDGFFYDKKGNLVAFDTRWTQEVHSVVVRKDLLNAFLLATDMKLVWFVEAQKEIYLVNHAINCWSDWNALYVYDGNDIQGELMLTLVHEI